MGTGRKITREIEYKYEGSFKLIQEGVLNLGNLCGISSRGTCLTAKPMTFIKFFFNVYLLLRDRETQSLSRGEAERWRDTESKAGSRL